MSSRDRSLSENVFGFMVGLLIVGVIALAIGAINASQFINLLIFFVSPVALIYIILKLRRGARKG